jgi:predicted Zn-dependent protease
MQRGRWGVALILAVLSLAGYWSSRQVNPVTGESQHVQLTAGDEIALGRKAAPELAQQYGGEARDPAGQRAVDAVGGRIVSRTPAGGTEYQFDFHLLDDQRIINAFALPGGQVFITEALYRKLHTQGELAGVLGHEIGHVIARHSAEHLAQAQLMQGLGGAAVIASSDPDHPERSQRNAMLAMAVTQLVNLKFGRNDELEADRLGVKLMSQAGYDPRAMIGVMEVLQTSAKGRSTPPEFFSTHPNPENRITRIKEAIRAVYPQGIPAGLAQ